MNLSFEAGALRGKVSGLIFRNLAEKYDAGIAEKSARVFDEFWKVNCKLRYEDIKKFLMPTPDVVFYGSGPGIRTP